MKLEEELKHVEVDKKDLKEKGIELLINGDLNSYGTMKGSDKIYIFKNSNNGYQYQKNMRINKFMESDYYKQDIEDKYNLGGSNASDK